MPKSQEPKNPVESQVKELLDVKQSVPFNILLKQHREYLKKQVLAFVREKKFDEAYGEVCKYDDIDAIFRMIDLRIKQLKEGGRENAV